MRLNRTGSLSCQPWCACHQRTRPHLMLQRVGMRLLLVVSAGVGSTVEGQVNCTKGLATNSNRVRNWRGKAVMARSDNTSAVAVINSRSSCSPELMHLLRCPFFFEARHSFRLEAAHIPGKDNVLVDDLSRNRASFYSRYRQLSLLPPRSHPTY